MLRTLTISSLVTAGLFLGATPVPTYAADATGGASEAPGVLEEITVTARRREESLESVPVAITALSGADMREKNIFDTRDLATVTPSLNESSSFSSNQLNFSMRGQVPDFTSGSLSPTVQTYFNEVAPIYPSAAPFYDLSSVQVLRGPQGTLFGRAAIGGAVLFAPARPGWDLDGYVQAQGGNLDDHEIQGALTIPLIDHILSVRVAGDIVRRDGYTHIINEGNYDLDNKDFDAVRLSIRYQPTDWLQNDTVYSYHDVDQHSGSFELLQGAPANGTASFLANPANPAYANFLAQNPDLAAIPGVAGGLQTYLATQQQIGPRKIYNNVPSDILIYQEQIHFLSNITQATFGPVTVKNIFGYQHMYQAEPFDADGSPLPLLEAVSFQGLPTSFALEDHQYDDELQVLGTALNGKVDWVAGGYYQNNGNDHRPGGSLQNAAFGFLLGSGNANQSLATQTSKALFTQETLHLTDRLRFTAGVRDTWDSDDSQAILLAGPVNSRGVVDGPSFCFGHPTVPFNVNAPECRGPALDVHDSGINWTAGLDYQVTDTTLVYVASRHGYQPGGVNSVTTIQTIATYSPASTTDAEIGIKTDQNFNGVAVRFNLAAYNEWLKNSQRGIAIIDPRSGQLQSITANAASSTVRGVEAELTVVPTDRFKVIGFADYTDAKYKDFDIPNLGLDPNDPNCANPATRTTCNVVVTSINSAKGNPFPLVPKVRFGLTGEYNQPLPGDAGRLALSATFYHQDAFNLQVIQSLSPEAVAGSEDLLSARLEWSSVFGRPIDISLFGKNLTNKVYLIGGEGTDNLIGFSFGSYGEPRTYGAQVRYRIGASAK